MTLLLLYLLTVRRAGGDLSLRRGWLLDDDFCLLDLTIALLGRENEGVKDRHRAIPSIIFEAVT
jgi:hypothetical protein